MEDTLMKCSRITISLAAVGSLPADNCNIIAFLQ